MRANLKIITESLSGKCKWPKLAEQEESVKGPMSMENIGKNCQRLFPKKALDLDNLKYVIKTSRSKNSKYYLNHSPFQSIEKRVSQVVVFFKDVNVNQRTETEKNICICKYLLIYENSKIIWANQIQNIFLL